MVFICCAFTEMHKINKRQVIFGCMFLFLVKILIFVFK
jgi:hypothetical protein